MYLPNTLTVYNIPMWLEKFILDTFAKHYQQSREQLILNVKTIKPTVSTGENYVANLFSITIQLKHKCDNKFMKHHALVVKIAETGLNENVNELFQREIKFYKSIVESLHNEYKRIGEHVIFASKCYGTTDDTTCNNQILVFDDLTFLGYNVLNRRTGLDSKHIEVLVAKLAKYHAASAVYHERCGDFDAIFKSVYAGKFGGFIEKFMELALPNFIEIVKESEVLKKFTDQIVTWPQSTLKELIRITTPDSTKFNVLNHGDIWINNCLFSSINQNIPYDPLDVLFVDFQMSYWASPIIDLCYLFVPSTNDCVKTEAGFDAMLEHYHLELVGNLGKLGYGKNIPTKCDLYAEFQDRAFFGIFLAYHLMPLVMVDSNPELSDGVSAGDILLSQSDEGERFRWNMYHSRQYIKALELIFEVFYKKEFLNVSEHIASG